MVRSTWTMTSTDPQAINRPGFTLRQRRALRPPARHIAPFTYIPRLDCTITDLSQRLHMLPQPAGGSSIARDCPDSECITEDFGERQRIARRSAENRRIMIMHNLGLLPVSKSTRQTLRTDEIDFLDRRPFQLQHGNVQATRCIKIPWESCKRLPRINTNTSRFRQ